MALQHASLFEVIDLDMPNPIGSASTSSSLLRTSQLQILRLVLPKGECLPAHQVPGEITIQCLIGEVSVIASRVECRLSAGQLVALPANGQHSVQAHDTSVLVVTLVHAHGRSQGSCDPSH